MVEKCVISTIKDRFAFCTQRYSRIERRLRLVFSGNCEVIKKNDVLLQFSKSIIGEYLLYEAENIVLSIPLNRS